MFGSVGLAEMALGLVVGLFVLGVLGRLVRASHGPMLALKRFVVNDVSAGTPIGVEVLGRASGLVGWLLGVLKLGSETSLLVTDRQVIFRTGSLSGEVHHVVPMTMVASTSCGFHKPFWALVAATIFSLFALFGVFDVLTTRRAPDIFGNDYSSTVVAAQMFKILLNLVIAGALLAVYFFRRTLGIVVESSGGQKFGLAFKKSVVENASVDLPQVIAAIKAINQRILRVQQGAGV